MKKTMHTSRRKRFTSLALAVASVLTFVASIFSPWLSGISSAATTPGGLSNLNIFKRMDPANIINIPKQPGQTCYGVVSTMPKTKDNLLAEIFPGDGLLQTMYSPRTTPTHIDNGFITTKFGTFYDRGDQVHPENGSWNFTDLYHVVRDPGDLQIITFKEGGLPPDPVNRHDQNPMTGGASICSDQKLIRFGNYYLGWNRWNTGGTQAAWFYYENVTTSGSNLTGTMHFVDPFFNDDNYRFAGSNGQAGNFVVQGTPGPGAGDVSTTQTNGSWIDVGHIRLDDTHAGEQYQMAKWAATTTTTQAGVTDDNYSVYFLVAATGTRQDITWASGKGCVNPIPNGGVASPCTRVQGSGSNCVPFIAINQAVNLSRHGSATADFWINGGDSHTLEYRVAHIGGAPNAKFYDYDPATCNLIGAHPISIGSADNSKIWFYFSDKEKKMVTVFSDAAANSNEDKFRGVYEHKEGTQTNEYRGGLNGCGGQALLTPSGNFPVAWTFTDGNCGSATSKKYGTVNVRALGGAEGEAAYAATLGASTPTGGGGDTAAAPPKVGCDAIIEANPLSWIICPVVALLNTGVNWLDSAINDLLTVDTKPIFDDSTQTGAMYHQTWATFRTFALSLIVIAALVMVIAQAMGIEVMDAYTVRKVLPALVVAAIFITLSWPLMNAAVTISNDLGQGIRSLIYAPFARLNAQGIGLNNLSLLIGDLLVVGGILALGVMGLLSLAITAFLAVLVGVIVLTLRVLIIIFLILVAPFAIACFILPGTKRAGTLWRDTLLGLLLAYLVISGIIAASRVFSITALVASQAPHAAPTNFASSAYFAYSQTIGQIAAFISYFGSYFIIGPLTIKTVGAAGAVLGGVTGAFSGAFGALKNQRAGIRKTRGKKMKEGNLYTGFRGNNVFSRTSRGLAQGFNRVSSGIGTGGAGHFGLPTARGRAAMGQMRLSAADALMKSDEFHKIKENDYALRAASFANRTAAINGLRARGDMSEAQIRDAVASVESSIGFGATQQMAAAKGMIDTGTAYTNMQDWITTAARVSRGNQTSLADVVGYGNAAAKKNRMDLTPGFGDSMAAAQTVMRNGGMSQGAWDALTIKAVRNSGSATTVVSQGKEAVFQNIAAVSERLERAQRTGDTEYLAGAAGQQRQMERQADLQTDVDASILELTQAHYAAGAVGGGEHVFDVWRARQQQGAMTPEEQRALIDSGQARVFGGGRPDRPGGPGG